MQTESELISASPVAAVCLVAQSAQSLSAEVISQQFGGEAEDRNSLLLNTDCSFFSYYYFNPNKIPIINRFLIHCSTWNRSQWNKNIHIHDSCMLV